jgi:cellulose synthase operon protein YhjQ
VNVVAIRGSAGGVGTTTVAAQLTAQLAAHHRNVLAFDFSPHNTLRLHFGMAWNEDAGLAPQMLSGKPWHDAAFQSHRSINFVPFGRIQDGHTLADFLDIIRAEPHWFANRIAELDLAPNTFIICDCSAEEASIQSQVMSIARLALIVVAPDAISCASAPNIASTALSQGAHEALFLLNEFDSTRELDRDISLIIHNDFREHLIPVTIHRDEHIREAIACKQTVLEYASASRAAYDFDALATWLFAHFSHVKNEGSR